MYQDLLALLVLEGRLVYQELPRPKVPQVQRAQLVTLVKTEQLVLPDHKVLLDHKDLQVLLPHKVQLALLVQLV